MPEASAKKPHKKRKSRPKPKKRKPKLTKEFQDTEREVAEVLNSTELLTDSLGESPRDLAEAFFCSSGTKESPEKVPTQSSIDGEEQSGTPRVQTLSSFIQIEDDEPIKWVPAEKIFFDKNLLYTPSPTVDPYIQNNQDENPVLKPSANLIRLVNRYQVEGKHDLIASGSSLKNQANFFRDDLLYASVCEREFRPVFLVIKPGDSSIPIIPSRTLITLAITGLRFTEHPLQQEEHRLSSNLENLLDVYFKKKKSKLILDLRAELERSRKAVNRLLEGASSENLPHLEENLNKLKHLRNRLHQEETTNKELLRNILDSWIQLKKLRKTQEFHWTSLKLKIKLNEVNVAHDTAVWTKRFETELNEIYREELETFYRNKRLYGSNPDGSCKPKKPNLEAITKELKQTLKQCSRSPGEPDIDIVRSKLTDACHPLEKIKTYFMRILFDEQLVGSTGSFRLEPDLSLAINESFGIYLERRIPKEIKVKLYEKKRLSAVPVKIANILVPLPSVGNNHRQRDVVVFSSHKRENISGRLEIEFNCEEGVYSKENLDAILPAPAPRTKIPDNVIENWRRNHFIDHSTEPSQYTPSPRAALTSEEEDDDKDGHGSQKDDDDDTCTFQETLLEFCPREELDNNPRLRFLSARYKNDLKMKGITLMPFMENQLEDASEERIIEIGNWMDPIDIHKHNGKKYLRNLYAVVRNHCDHLININGSSGNLLIENSIGSLRALIGSIFSMFGPSRPLNPERSEPQVQITHHNVQKINIVVNVVRATGIPVRSFTTPALEGRSNSSASMFSSQTFKYSNVRPFVSATFMDRSGRTMTADGSSPTWNEQLILQITGSPMDLKGDLKIAVFDEFVENHISDERSLEVYQRFQCNWLGEYRLPISTILARQRIEGVFELNSPRIILGYNPPSLSEALPIENVPEIKERINVWLYVSVEPSFEMPQVITKNLDCSELKEVRQHIHEWCVQVRDIQPERFINPLVCTMDGKLMCMTRLLEPVPLPIEEGENVLETVCKYVSLLNVPRHFDPCTQFGGIWLNNQTLLDTGWGSPKDLGVLLANFLLTLGIRCWVVLGVSYPHGDSAYALYQEENDFILLDPSTGIKCSTKDTYCPMNKVFYIFSNDNIFCNVQRENRVSMMSFDVTDASAWFPMFSKKNPAPLGGVQKLNYEYGSSLSTTELRRNIERKIMKKINAWRPMQKTVWNRAFQSTMQKILVDLEYESISQPSEINHAERLHFEFRNYRLFGFTLNFSYSNLSSISDRIKSTGIHLNADKKVEFTVAVHVHSYPYNVLSVWVFLVSAVPLLNTNF